MARPLHPGLQTWPSLQSYFLVPTFPNVSQQPHIVTDAFTHCTQSWTSWAKGHPLQGHRRLVAVPGNTWDQRGQSQLDLHRLECCSASTGSLVALTNKTMSSKILKETELTTCTSPQRGPQVAQVAPNRLKLSSPWQVSKSGAWQELDSLAGNFSDLSRKATAKPELGSIASYGENP